MNSSDPFSSAYTLWSLFAGGPAQFFVDPQEQVVDHVSPAQVDARTQAELEGPQWAAHTFEFEGTTHRFKLYVPRGDGNDASRSPMPMIVMLHGAQQGPDDFAAGTRMNEFGEAHGYVVVYPEQSESANAFRCWNWFDPVNQQRGSGETAMLAALTRKVMATCDVDPKRVYLAGMSAGGAMAVNLAITYPDLFAAAAVHSGMAFGVADEPFAALCAMNDGMGKIRLPKASEEGDGPLRAVPFMIFHGDADDTVHPRNSDQIVEMILQSHDATTLAPTLATDHADPAQTLYPYSHRLYRDRRGATIAEQWIVHGLRHAWSGGHADGTHTDARGPQASLEMIRFFSQFSLAGQAD